jgi:hypothetical protein
MHTIEKHRGACGEVRPFWDDMRPVARCWPSTVSTLLLLGIVILLPSCPGLIFASGGLLG